MDTNFVKFLKIWTANGGQESTSTQLLRFAEQAGLVFENTQTHHGRATILGQRLSGTRDQRIIVDDEVLIIRIGKIRGSQFYKLQQESTGVHLEANSFSEPVAATVFTALVEERKRVETLLAKIRECELPAIRKMLDEGRQDIERLLASARQRLEASPETRPD